MKALVTGSCGFIGSHLVEMLVNKGYDVFCLIRKTSNTKWLNKQKVEFILGDYSDRKSLSHAVEGMDYIFHLGAVIEAPDWETYYSVNTVGTQNLIISCSETNPNIKRFIFVSSIAASGPSKKGVLKNETDECRPISLYGKSKLLAEKIVNEFRNKIPIVIIRPANVLGIRQKQLYRLLKLVKRGILPLLGGNGEKRISLCFVQDLVKALILAAEKDQVCGKTYFVTNNQIYSWQEMLQFVAQILKGNSLVIKIPFPALYIIAWISEIFSKMIKTNPLVTRQQILSSKRYWLFDNQKIQKELGFKPEIGFEAGIKDIIHWYQQEGLL